MNNDPLERVLFEWEYGDFFKIRDSLRSVGIYGETGSAKSTASAALLIAHYLRNGYGFLVLAAKPEVEQWRKYCQAYGREEDLVIFGPNSGQYFNFLDYEMKRGDFGKGIAHNIANILQTIIKSGFEESGGSDKAFWTSSLQKLLVNTIELCLMNGSMKFKHIYDIIRSAPKNPAQLNNVDWRNSSKCFVLIQHLAKHLTALPDTPDTRSKINSLRLAEDFFLDEWLNLSEKTRSIIDQYFSAFADRFMRPPLNDLFQNNRTTITPEDSLEDGKIIVMDLPYLYYERTGQDAQILWKYVWMRAAQRRVIDDFSRPACLFTDECQYFLTDYDALFQSTCRSSRTCSVYITQNLPLFYIHSGAAGDMARNRFRALAGNFSTKIFHANSDPETNDYAADLIGKDWKWSQNLGQSMGEHMSFNQGQSQVWEYIVPPAEFSKLKTGGPDNNFEAEAIIHRQGKAFASTGYHYKRATFKQILL
jgi:hypothetical protein